MWPHWRKAVSYTHLDVYKRQATVKEICYFTGISESVIKNLEKKGIIELYETEVYRTPREAEVEPCDGVQLNRDQKAAFSKLLKAMEQPKGSAALLFGVTGSGKTCLLYTSKP